MRQEQPNENSMIVAVRGRPLTQTEKTQENISTLHVVSAQTLMLLDPSQHRLGRSRAKQYSFDFLFDESSTQETVFEKTTKGLIQDVLHGYNATVFAYGATNAGKTYTMVGGAQQPGLMYNSFLDLFVGISSLSHQRDYKVRLSYLEIYNEVVRDLLNPCQENLELREDKLRGVVVSGLSEISPSNSEEVLNALDSGNRHRTCEPTQANLTSSRSHAVLQLVTEHRDLSRPKETISGKLTLIDLAGSERASETLNRGLRLLEGANINRSLLALSNCINALSESHEKGGKVYIPYRDSKLTRLLKDSLGGNCRTVMIACVSPHPTAFEDTKNTLKYAERARRIKNSLQQNVVNVHNHISRYTAVINSLKQEISQLKEELKGGSGSEFLIENYLIEVNSLFEDEARARKSMCLAENAIDSTGLVLYSRQLEVNPSREVIVLAQALQTHQLTLQKEEKQLNSCIKKRRELELKWHDERVPEPCYTQLMLHLKRNVLKMSHIEVERQKQHSEAVTKQRDYFFDTLQSRSSISPTQRNTSPREATPFVSMAGKRYHFLPPITVSRIPKPAPLRERAAHLKGASVDLLENTRKSNSTSLGALNRLKITAKYRRNP